MLSETVSCHHAWKLLGGRVDSQNGFRSAVAGGQSGVDWGVGRGVRSHTEEGANFELKNFDFDFDLCLGFQIRSRKLKTELKFESESEKKHGQWKSQSRSKTKAKSNAIRVWVQIPLQPGRSQS